MLQKIYKNENIKIVKIKNIIYFVRILKKYDLNFMII